MLSQSIPAPCLILKWYGKASIVPGRRPASKGADILYQLALSDQHSEASGKYFDNDRGDFSRAHPDAYNEMKVDQLIRITNDLLRT